MALKEKRTVQTVTYIAGEDLSSKDKLYVPLKRSAANTVVQCTDPADNVVGFLYSLNAQGGTVAVTENNNYQYMIAANTSITAVGDKVMLAPAVSGKVSGVVKLSGTSQDCLGEAEEIPATAGDFLLVKFNKINRI